MTRRANVAKRGTGSLVSGRLQSASLEVASSESTRDMNRDALLLRVRTMQPVSRVDLARTSGLQPSTVSSIVEGLLGERWIRESAMVKTARGRRPTLLSLSDDMLLLVADVRPTRIVAAVVDLNGRVLERQVIPAGTSAAQSVAALIEVLLRLRQGHASQTFQGVGVSLPGRIDSSTGRLVFAPHLAWGDFPIRERMREGLGLDVQLESGANASLLSELWFGSLGGVRNAIVLTVSDGIDAAMLADGRLVTGQSGLAGEFGHIAIDPSGPLCACGSRGCWEVFASSRAARSRYRMLEPGAPLPSILELHGMAMDGDAAARTVLEQQARAIGEGLHLLNAIMSPDVILLAGDVSLSFGSFRTVIEETCRAGAMDGVGPRILSIGDGEIGRLRGAAAAVLQRHPGYYRAAHGSLDQR